MDYSIFHLHRRLDNPGDPLIVVFSIFPGGTFSQLGTFSLVGDWNLFSGIIFFQQIELFKINSREFMSQTIIYSRAYWFLKIWLSTPIIVWIKNVINQCMGLVNKSLLADLMTMILNWNKTDGGCSTLICVQTSIYPN